MFADKLPHASPGERHSARTRGTHNAWDSTDGLSARRRRERVNEGDDHEVVCASLDSQWCDDGTRDEYRPQGGTMVRSSNPRETRVSSRSPGMMHAGERVSRTQCGVYSSVASIGSTSC
jgi:hypothetical protein